MKYFLLLLPYLLGFQLSAQNCSYEKREIDEFTDNEVILTKPVTFINFTEKVKCSLSRIDSSKFFLLEMTTGKPLYKIERGDLLYFILEDGNKVILEPTELIVFSNEIHGYNNIKVVYDLVGIDNLLKSEISKMRVTTSDGFFDYEIIKAKAKKFFNENLVCIK